jgi:hypothetical protein
VFGNVQNLPPSGLPRATSAADDMNIVQTVKKIPNVIFSEILHSLQVAGPGGKGHPQTMCNRLHTMGYRGHNIVRYANLSSISVKNRETQLEFARSLPKSNDHSGKR